MKKLLLLVFVFILSSSVFAQNTDKDDTYYNTQQYLQKVFEKTPEALRMKLINNIVVANIPSTGVDGIKDSPSSFTSLASSQKSKFIELDVEPGWQVVEFGFNGVTSTTAKKIYPGTIRRITIDDPSKIYIKGKVKYTIYN